jgi:hypothetical protein
MSLTRLSGHRQIFRWWRFIEALLPPIDSRYA